MHQSDKKLRKKQTAIHVKNEERNDMKNKEFKELKRKLRESAKYINVKNTPLEFESQKEKQVPSLRCGTSKNRETFVLVKELNDM